MSKGIQTHEATKIVLKEIIVDNKLIPVVQWINSLNCYTLNGCQGDDNNNHCCLSNPYVSFVCCDLKSLDHIISVVKAFNFVNKDKYENPVSLKLKTSLVQHFALSRSLKLSMLNEEILTLFCKHINGFAEINKDSILEESLGDINLI